jgi:hypothetical protein
LAKPAVSRGQVGFGQGILEQIFSKIALAAMSQHLGRNFSWFFTAHNLK